MKPKSDEKFEKKLTFGLENDMRNFANFHDSKQKSQNWNFYWVLLSKPTKKSLHHSGGIPKEFHWSHGNLLENDWHKWNLWNSSEIPLDFQQFIILTPLKFHL